MSQDLLSSLDTDSTVVIIDNNESDTEPLQEWLKNKQIKSVVFTRITDALYALDHFEWIKNTALLITEFYLPGAQINGKQICDIFKNKIRNLQCLIIVNKPVQIDTEFMTENTGYRFVQEDLSKNLAGAVA